MSIVYLEFNVQVHGLKMESLDGAGFLEGWIKQAILAGLKGNNKEMFNFRDEFESDVEVLLSNSAGTVDNV